MYTFRRSNGISHSLVLRYSLSYGHRQEAYVGSSSFIPVYPGGLFRTFQRRFQRLNPKDANYFECGEHPIFQHDRREVDHLRRGIVLLGVRYKARAYTHVSVDRNNVAGRTHQSVVAGLLPSTVDHCRVTAANGNGVYLLANEGYWDSGSAFFLARVPRARLKALKGSDYQFYIGGNGALDSSWMSTQEQATPVISNKRKLGEPSVQFIPSLNRYLLLTFCYPEPPAIANRHSEHTRYGVCMRRRIRGGPWTLINSTEWPKLGYYNPIILNNTAYSGTSPTIMVPGDFFGVGTFQMYTSIMTSSRSIIKNGGHFSVLSLESKLG